TGALWVLTGSSHEDSSQTLEVFRLDPASGSARKGALDPIPTGPQPESSLAIDRRCPAGDTRRCVQGGRFALEATWRDAEGNADSARVAPAGSADTALLWFFEPSNWELMVKVLDGCEINGHFWVYAAASTDVEYQLSVTDLETGQLFTYQNPLGTASPAVDAIQAFSGCP
ncbi:MAG: hypothetical protein MI919_09865, partial [Holophagales bacterium]|nr:hypothetical protein [Holophagales bacterium]